MTPGESEQAFRAFIRERGHHLDLLGVGEGVHLMLEFFEERTCSAIAEMDGDMLLFQWGTYDWGSGRNFEIDITRQFIEAALEDDDAISQLHLTFKFQPDPDLEVLKGNLWCPARSSIAAFRAQVLNHPALTAVSKKCTSSQALAFEYV